MNYRHSKQRDRILDVVQSTDTHPTADGIYRILKKELPDLSMGTVYRNLAILGEQGLIRKLPSGSTFDRYDGNVSPHYHLVCESCGAVEDLDLPADTSLDSRAQKRSGFLVRHHRIDFFGICDRCQHTSLSTSPERRGTWPQSKERKRKKTS